MSKDTGLEKFEPGDELMKELDAMNGIVDGRGDHWKEKRLAAGEKPPLKKVPKKNDKLLHDAKSLLDVGPVKGGRGKLTLKEMTKDLPAKLVALGLDPIDYIAQMLKDQDSYLGDTSFKPTDGVFAGSAVGTNMSNTPYLPESSRPGETRTDAPELHINDDRA